MIGFINEFVNDHWKYTPQYNLKWYVFKGILLLSALSTHFFIPCTYNSSSFCQLRVYQSWDRKNSFGLKCWHLERDEFAAVL